MPITTTENAQEQIDPDATAAHAERVFQRMCITPHGPKRKRLADQHVELSKRVHFERGYVSALASLPSAVPEAGPKDGAALDAIIAIQRRALLAVRDWQGEQNPAGNTYRTPVGFKGSPFDYLRKLANDGLKDSARIAWGIDEPAASEGAIPAGMVLVPREKLQVLYDGLQRMYETLEDEGDRVYLASTNDVDLLPDFVAQIAAMLSAYTPKATPSEGRQAGLAAMVAMDEELEQQQHPGWMTGNDPQSAV